MKRIITLIILGLMLGLSLCFVIVSPGKTAFVAGAPTTTVSSPTTSTTTKTTTTTPSATSTTTKTTTTTTTTTTTGAGAIDHYAISSIAATQTAGTALSITIQAQDNKNNNITTGSETVDITFYKKDAGATTTPVVTKSGTASFKQTMTVAQSGQQIIFTGATSGGIGKSDIFTVVANPAMDRYAVSGIATPQIAGIGFNVTIQAQDIYGNDITTGSEAVKVELAKTDKGATPDSIVTKNGTTTFKMTMTAAQTGQQIIFTGGTSGKTVTSGTFSINPGALAAIAVSPNTKTLDIRATQQFTATGLDSCNNEVHCTPVWSVMDPDAGSIDTSGFFTAGIKAGTYTSTIAAASGAISGNASVTVNQTSFPVTVTQPANGTITPGTTNVNYGSSQTFTITPAAGCHITDVQVDGFSIGAVSSYLFNNVTVAHSLTVSFAINTYTVTFTAGVHGIISGTAVQTISYGGNATAPTITSTAGWTFTGWDTAFTNITSNLTITAQYTLNTYTVTFAPGAHGTISGTAMQTISYGGNATAPTITSAAGWTFTGWDTAFTNITSNLTITAQYSLKAYNVTFTPGIHGTLLNGNMTQLVVYGNSAIAPVVTANPGWTFTGWDTTFTNVTSSLLITAQYSQNIYTVTFTPGEHGVLDSGNGQQTLTYDTDAIAPKVNTNPGWTFTGWDIKFTNITSNLAVTAQYSLNLYTLTFSAGAHGALTGGLTTQFLSYGENAIAPTITADSGWTFTGWDKEFTNVTADLNMTAQYSIIAPERIELLIAANASLDQNELSRLPGIDCQTKPTAAAPDITQTDTDDINYRVVSFAPKLNLSMIAGIVIYTACFCVILALFILRFLMKRNR